MCPTTISWPLHQILGNFCEVRNSTPPTSKSMTTTLPPFIFYHFQRLHRLPSWNLSSLSDIGCQGVSLNLLTMLNHSTKVLLSLFLKYYLFCSPYVMKFIETEDNKNSNKGEKYQGSWDILVFSIFVIGQSFNDNFSH